MKEKENNQVQHLVFSDMLSSMKNIVFPLNTQKSMFAFMLEALTLI
jgi:hypothetical protein